MPSWKELLITKKLLIADGAWGTELAKLGLAPGEPPEDWNLTQPDKVRSVAASYVQAGADIVITNTFGGCPFKMEKEGMGDKVAEINRRAVELSKEAAGDTALVFASIGPSGEFMEPLGAVSESEMIATFAKQAKALADGGADAILVETMTDLGEAKAAMRAARDVTDLPVAVSMTFDKGAKGYATMMGVKPDQAAAELEAAGADIVGANCGAGIVQMIDIMRAMRSATKLPLWAKSNAGLPELEDGKTVFKQTPGDMAARMPILAAIGANIIGGCCGTTPEHIRALADARPAIIAAELASFDPTQSLKM
jgi:5-methyltetrahydrofolate--homocysteine methyltransferase